MPVQEISKIWPKVQNNIKARIGEVAFNTWFGPIKTKEQKTSQQTQLIIEVPDKFFQEWFTSHYLDLVQASVKDLAGQDVVVQLSVNPSIIKQGKKNKLHEFEALIQEKKADDIQLNPSYTFENFVVGPSNRFTHAACLAVAQNPAKNYNPLFIYGRVGLGKTHLMQAICHYVKKQHPRISITYLSSERFTNELINSIQHHSMESFRRKYRNVDILLLDDIHFIAGKESTQEEFFHTFNTLHDAHKQIIISSDRSPKEINKLEERLVSRFSWGLITDIQPPDLETRIAILNKKIEKQKAHIPNDVILFLAESITNNIRELEGALNRLSAYALLEDTEINLPLAKDVLKDMLRETVKNITIDSIVKKVAAYYRLNPSDLKTKRRNKNLVETRQIAMYLSRELTDLSLPEIGLYFGGKDHTTVLHSYNKIKQKINQNQQFKNLVDRIIFDIQG